MFRRRNGVLLLFLSLVACGRNIQSREAVRQGVIDHLASRSGLDLKSMDIDVASVTFRENEADATVSFRAKGSTDPATGMQMVYTLQREGNRWVVKGRKDAGGTPHGGSDPGPVK